jgi:hypothetical protein
LSIILLKSMTFARLIVVLFLFMISPQLVKISRKAD